MHHLPCSHVIAACSVSGLDAASYVSQYFTKEAAAQTWCHEIYGIGSLGPFTQKNLHPILIPDAATKRGIGRRQTRRIRNGMDESEDGKRKKRCNLCGADGHTYKKCPQLSVPNVLPRLDLPGIRRMDRLHLQEFAASSCAFICVYEIKYIVYVLCLNVLFN